MSNTKLKVRDFRNKQYFQVDNIYLNGYAKYLGVAATAVYMSLCRHSHNNTQECFPSQKLIADEHHITVKTVKRCIKKLKEANIIIIAREKTEKGRWLNNIYILLDKSYWKSPEDIKDLWKVQGTFKTKTRGHQRPNKVTHIEVYSSLSPTSPSSSENLRERILEKLKKHFSNHSIPNSIPARKLDLLLFKIERGEVDPTKIQSVAAYLKGLQIESFPTFEDRKADNEKITEKKEEETKKQKAVDEVWQRAEKEFQEANNETREMLFEQAKKKLPDVAKNSKIAIHAEAIRIFQESYRSHH